MRYLIFLLPVFLVGCLGENQMKNAVISQSDELGIALKNGQLETYLDKMAHFVFVNDNERNQLKEKLQDQLDYLSSRRNKIIKVQSAIHSDIYENKGYYQCMVKQVASIKNDFTIYGSNTYLLAVSKDGETWKFADVTNFSEQIIKQIFPELSDDLKFNNKDK